MDNISARVEAATNMLKETADPTSTSSETAPPVNQSSTESPSSSQPSLEERVERAKELLAQKAVQKEEEAKNVS